MSKYRYRYVDAYESANGVIEATDIAGGGCPPAAEPYATRAVRDLVAFREALIKKEGTDAAVSDWASQGVPFIDGELFIDSTGTKIPHMFVHDSFHLYQEGKLSARSIGAIARVKAIAIDAARTPASRIQELRALQNLLSNELDALVDQLC